jgi:hypothetical protein
LLKNLNNTSPFAKFSVELTWNRILRVDNKSSIRIHVWNRLKRVSQQTDAVALIGTVDFYDIVFISFVALTELC